MKKFIFCLLSLTVISIYAGKDKGVWSKNKASTESTETTTSESQNSESKEEVTQHAVVKEKNTADTHETNAKSKKSSKGTSSAVIQHEKSIFAKAWTLVVGRSIPGVITQLETNDEVEKENILSATHDIEWAINTLITYISTEKAKNDLNTIKGLQATVNHNKDHISNLGKIISLSKKFKNIGINEAVLTNAYAILNDHGQLSVQYAKLVALDVNDQLNKTKKSRKEIQSAKQATNHWNNDIGEISEDEYGDSCEDLFNKLRTLELTQK